MSTHWHSNKENSPTTISSSNSAHQLEDPGNNNEFDVDKISSHHFIDAARSSHTTGNTQMLSLGSSTRPSNLPRECSAEPRSEDRRTHTINIEDMATQSSTSTSRPSGTGLDEAPRTRENMTPKGLSRSQPLKTQPYMIAITQIPASCSVSTGTSTRPSADQQNGRDYLVNPGSVYGDWTLRGSLSTLRLDASNAMR